jgi:pyridoxine 4-dehydrogenase
MQRYPLGRFSVARIGFGAMQLPGPGVFGPPRDRDAALAVLRRAVDLGVDHIDTSQYYGPGIANELNPGGAVSLPRHSGVGEQGWSAPRRVRWLAALRRA